MNMTKIAIPFTRNLTMKIPSSRTIFIAPIAPNNFRHYLSLFVPTGRKSPKALTLPANFRDDNLILKLRGSLFSSLDALISASIFAAISVSLNSRTDPAIALAHKAVS
jgi:hypothetical protein